MNTTQHALLELATALENLHLIPLPTLSDSGGELDWHVYAGQRFVGGLEWRDGALRASRGGDRRTLVRLVGLYNAMAIE